MRLKDQMRAGRTLGAPPGPMPPAPDPQPPVPEPEQPPRPIDRTGAHNFSAGWVPK
jgi:hypothetical protein